MSRSNEVNRFTKIKLAAYWMLDWLTTSILSQLGAACRRCRRYYALNDYSSILQLNRLNHVLYRDSAWNQVNVAIAQNIQRLFDGIWSPIYRLRSPLYTDATYRLLSINTFEYLFNRTLQAWRSWSVKLWICHSNTTHLNYKLGQNIAVKKTWLTCFIVVHNVC